MHYFLTISNSVLFPIYSFIFFLSLQGHRIFTFLLLQPVVHIWFSISRLRLPKLPVAHSHCFAHRCVLRTLGGRRARMDWLAGCSAIICIYKTQQAPLCLARCVVVSVSSPRPDYKSHSLSEDARELLSLYFVVGVTLRDKISRRSSHNWEVFNNYLTLTFADCNCLNVITPG